jgi:hypothetical protein
MLEYWHFFQMETYINKKMDGDEPNQDSIYVSTYGNVTMKPTVQLIYANKMFFKKQNGSK